MVTNKNIVRHAPLASSPANRAERGYPWNPVILVRHKILLLGVALMSRGITHSRWFVESLHGERSCRSSWPKWRLPRNPYLYAFLGSAAIHIAAAAVFLSLPQRPATVPGDLGQGNQPVQLVATIQLGTITVVADDAAAKERPAAIVPAPKPPKLQPMAAPAPKHVPMPEVEPTPKPNLVAQSEPIERPAEAGPVQLASLVPIRPARTFSADGFHEGGASTAGGPDGHQGVPSATVNGDRAGAVMARPDYLHNPPPRYPDLARQRGWQGTAILRVRVLPDGTADSVELIKTSGYRVLDRISVQTVRNWQFIPARAGKRAVSSWVEIPIRFQLVGS